MTTVRTLCSNTSFLRCWTFPTPPPGGVGQVVQHLLLELLEQFQHLLLELLDSSTAFSAAAHARAAGRGTLHARHSTISSGTKAGNLLETLPPVGFARFPERFSGTLARRCVSNSQTPCSNTYSEPSVGLFQHLVWAKCLTPPHSRRLSNVGPRGLDRGVR